RPRQWVLRDAVLLDIVRAAPATLRALAGIPGLAERTVKRAGDDILEIVRSAPDRITDYCPPEGPDESQKKLLKRIQSRIAERAEELGIAAEVLAPRRALSAALFGGRDLRLFRGWRKALIGDEVLSLLEGG
ncbi:MAG: HRDC domain-containing protein, partial [Woeseiaceae bacterium]